MTQKMVTITREGDLLRLLTVPIRGMVYELCEDIGLDRWEGRSWLDDSDVEDLIVGRTASEVMGSFPEDVVDLFFDALEGDAVSEARAEPLRRLRALIEDERWDEVSVLGIKLALDPYIAGSAVDVQATFISLSQAASQIQSNRLTSALAR